MIYAGVEDFICNWLGNFQWVTEMSWDGQRGFNSEPLKRWTSPDGRSDAGEVKAYGPLSFVKVFGAGHMVPLDEPENALKMITSFTRDQPLA